MAYVQGATEVQAYHGRLLLLFNFLAPYTLTKAPADTCQQPARTISEPCMGTHGRALMIEIT